MNKRLNIIEIPTNAPPYYKKISDKFGGDFQLQ